MTFEELKTDRLILRKISPKELIFMFENYPETQIKTLLGLNTVEEYEKEKSRYEKGYTTYNISQAYFQLIDIASGRIIGKCGFHNWFAEHRRAELGYDLKDDRFKGQGLMTEALAVVIDYGFSNMNLHRIEALVGPDNTPSLKLMARFGFVQEGLLHEHYFINNRFEDSLVFSKLVAEYKSNG